MLLSWPALLAMLGFSMGALAVAIYRRWDEIEAYLGSVFSRIREAWNANSGEFGEAMRAVFDAVVMAIPNMLGDVFASLDAMADGLVASLREAAQSALSAVGDAVSGAFANVAEIAAAAWAKLPDGLKDAVEAIKALFSGIGDAIKAQFDRLESMVGRLVDSLKAKVQALLRAVGLASGAASGSSGASAAPGYAGGGQVRGPGTSTSDSILARLSTGEFVVQAKAVRHYGPQLFDLLNRLRLPRGVAPTAAPGRAAAGTRRDRNTRLIETLRRVERSGTVSLPALARAVSRAPAPRGKGRPSGSILARLSNGEFVVQAAAVKHYGPALFELLNRLRLPKGGALPAFAAGGPVSGAPERVSLAGLLGSSGGKPVRLELPAFARGGSASTHAIHDFRRAVENYRSQIVNQVLPAFASGGAVYNARHQVRNFSQVMSGFGAVALIPALAAGGIVPTGAAFAQSTAQTPSAPYANLTLMLGSETFSGLLAPRDTAESLMRYAEGQKVRRAGKKPGWVS